MKFKFSYEHRDSVDELKDRLTKAPVLRPPNYDEGAGMMILTVDASPIGVGAMLGQEDISGKRYIYRYESQKFNNREKRYPQVKRELYGLKLIIKKLRAYLYGIRFMVETDARPIIGMLNRPDLPNNVMSCWISYILLFDFEIRHIPGKLNVVADYLSRQGCDEEFMN